MLILKVGIVMEKDEVLQKPEQDIHRHCGSHESTGHARGLQASRGQVLSDSKRRLEHCTWPSIDRSLDIFDLTEVIFNIQEANNICFLSVIRERRYISIISF